MSLRYDWYQTDQKVVVTVMLKNAKEKNLRVEIELNRLRVTADNYELDLNLFGPINVNASSYQDYPTKVEITLMKNTGVRWTTLERKLPDPSETNTDLVTSTVGAPNVNGALSTPLPPIHKRDWDSLAREVEKSEEEEAHSEEALQRLFRHIYSTSSPEVRKAMNKSYSESGGTVLSTNWTDVSKGKVDVKPPEGAEFRKWD